MDLLGRGNGTGCICCRILFWDQNQCDRNVHGTYTL